MSERRLDRGALVWGALFTVLGAAFLLQELGLWRIRGEVFLPVLLIVAGAMLLVSAVAGREGAPGHPEAKGGSAHDRTPGDEPGRSDVDRERGGEAGA